VKTKRIALSISTVLVILGLVLVACNQASAKNPKISISAGDSGKTITMNMGQTLEVTLDGNMTTGYNWVMQSMDPAILKQVGDPVYTPESNQIGAPGKIVLTFQPVKTGQANLVLNYMRPFEKNTDPSKIFQVTIVVK
jgi:predicted secreted protein